MTLCTLSFFFPTPSVPLLPKGQSPLSPYLSLPQRNDMQPLPRLPSLFLCKSLQHRSRIRTRGQDKYNRRSIIGFLVHIVEIHGLGRDILFAIRIHNESSDTLEALFLAQDPDQEKANEVIVLFADLLERAWKEGVLGLIGLDHLRFPLVSVFHDRLGETLHEGDHSLCEQDLIPNSIGQPGVFVCAGLGEGTVGLGSSTYRTRTKGRVDLDDDFSKVFIDLFSFPDQMQYIVV